ncbi:MAG: hypothetical protein R3Y36_08310 [Spirochaetales bacterium]
MTPSFVASDGTKICLYDRAELKNGRKGAVVEIFSETNECIVDFDDEDFDSVKMKDILKKIV